MALLEPLDFLARLAALVSPPRTHLTRYHGVFAPYSARRRRACSRCNFGLRNILSAAGANEAKQQKQ